MYATRIVLGSKEMIAPVTRELEVEAPAMSHGEMRVSDSAAVDAESVPTSVFVHCTDAARPTLLLAPAGRVQLGLSTYDTEKKVYTFLSDGILTVGETGKVVTYAQIAAGITIRPPSIESRPFQTFFTIRPLDATLPGGIRADVEMKRVEVATKLATVEILEAAVSPPTIVAKERAPLPKLYQGTTKDYRFKFTDTDDDSQLKIDKNQPGTLTVSTTVPGISAVVTFGGDSSDWYDHVDVKITTPLSSDFENYEVTVAWENAYGVRVTGGATQVLEIPARLEFKVTALGPLRFTMQDPGTVRTTAGKQYQITVTLNDTLESAPTVAATLGAVKKVDYTANAQQFTFDYEYSLDKVDDRITFPETFNVTAADGSNRSYVATVSDVMMSFTVHAPPWSVAIVGPVENKVTSVAYKLLYKNETEASVGMHTVEVLDIAEAVTSFTHSRTTVTVPSMYLRRVTVKTGGKLLNEVEITKELTDGSAFLKAVTATTLQQTGVAMSVTVETKDRGDQNIECTPPVTVTVTAPGMALPVTLQGATPGVFFNNDVKFPVTRADYDATVSLAFSHQEGSGTVTAYKKRDVDGLKNQTVKVHAPVLFEFVTKKFPSSKQVTLQLQANVDCKGNFVATLVDGSRTWTGITFTSTGLGTFEANWTYPFKEGDTRLLFPVTVNITKHDQVTDMGDRPWVAGHSDKVQGAQGVQFVRPVVKAEMTNEHSYVGLGGNVVPTIKFKYANEDVAVVNLHDHVWKYNGSTVASSTAAPVSNEFTYTPGTASPLSKLEFTNLVTSEGGTNEKLLVVQFAHHKLKSFKDNDTSASGNTFKERSSGGITNGYIHRQVGKAVTFDFDLKDVTGTALEYIAGKPPTVKATLILPDNTEEDDSGNVDTSSLPLLKWKIGNVALANFIDSKFADLQVKFTVSGGETQLGKIAGTLTWTYKVYSPFAVMSNGYGTVNMPTDVLLEANSAIQAGTATFEAGVGGADKSQVAFGAKAKGENQTVKYTYPVKESNVDIKKAFDVVIKIPASAKPTTEERQFVTGVSDVVHKTPKFLRIVNNLKIVGYDSSTGVPAGDATVLYVKLFYYLSEWIQPAGLVANTFVWKDLDGAEVPISAVSTTLGEQKHNSTAKITASSAKKLKTLELTKAYTTETVDGQSRTAEWNKGTQGGIVASAVFALSLDAEIEHDGKITSAASGSEITLKDESKTVTDGSGSYTANMSKLWKIRPDSKKSLTIRFTKLRLEQNYDRLVIYHVDSTTGNRIIEGGYPKAVVLTGVMNPEPIEIASGWCDIHFMSDAQNQLEGFDLGYAPTRTDHAVRVDITDVSVAAISVKKTVFESPAVAGGGGGAVTYEFDELKPVTYGNVFLRQHEGASAREYYITFKDRKGETLTFEEAITDLNVTADWNLATKDAKILNAQVVKPTVYDKVSAAATGIKFTLKADVRTEPTTFVVSDYKVVVNMKIGGKSLSVTIPVKAPLRFILTSTPADSPARLGDTKYTKGSYQLKVESNDDIPKAGFNLTVGTGKFQKMIAFTKDGSNTKFVGTWVNDVVDVARNDGIVGEVDSMKQTGNNTPYAQYGSSLQNVNRAYDSKTNAVIIAGSNTLAVVPYAKSVFVSSVLPKTGGTWLSGAGAGKFVKAEFRARMSDDTDRKFTSNSLTLDSTSVTVDADCKGEVTKTLGSATAIVSAANVKYDRATYVATVTSTIKPASATANVASAELSGYNTSTENGDVASKQATAGRQWLKQKTTTQTVRVVFSPASLQTASVTNQAGALVDTIVDRSTGLFDVTVATGRSGSGADRTINLGLSYDRVVHASDTTTYYGPDKMSITQTYPWVLTCTPPASLAVSNQASLDLVLKPSYSNTPQAPPVAWSEAVGAFKVVSSTNKIVTALAGKPTVTSASGKFVVSYTMDKRVSFGNADSDKNAETFNIQLALGSTDLVNSKEREWVAGISDKVTINGFKRPIAYAQLASYSVSETDAHSMSLLTDTSNNPGARLSSFKLDFFYANDDKVTFGSPTFTNPVWTRLGDRVDTANYSVQRTANQLVVTKTKESAGKLERDYLHSFSCKVDDPSQGGVGSVQLHVRALSRVKNAAPDVSKPMVDYVREGSTAAVLVELKDRKTGVLDVDATIASNATVTIDGVNVTGISHSANKLKIPVANVRAAKTSYTGTGLPPGLLKIKFANFHYDADTSDAWEDRTLFAGTGVEIDVTIHRRITVSFAKYPVGKLSAGILNKVRATFDVDVEETEFTVNLPGVLGTQTARKVVGETKVFEFAYTPVQPPSGDTEKTDETFTIDRGATITDSTGKRPWLGGTGTVVVMRTAHELDIVGYDQGVEKNKPGRPGVATTKVYLKAKYTDNAFVHHDTTVPIVADVTWTDGDGYPITLSESPTVVSSSGNPFEFSITSSTAKTVKSIHASITDSFSAKSAIVSETMFPSASILVYEGNALVTHFLQDGKAHDYKVLVVPSTVTGTDYTTDSPQALKFSTAPTITMGATTMSLGDTATSVTFDKKENDETVTITTAGGIVSHNGSMVLNPKAELGVTSKGYDTLHPVKISVKANSASIGPTELTFTSTDSTVGKATVEFYDGVTKVNEQIGETVTDRKLTLPKTFFAGTGEDYQKYVKAASGLNQKLKITVNKADVTQTARRRLVEDQVVTLERKACITHLVRTAINRTAGKITSITLKAVDINGVQINITEQPVVAVTQNGSAVSGFSIALESDQLTLTFNINDDDFFVDVQLPEALIAVAGNRTVRYSYTNEFGFTFSGTTTGGAAVTNTGTVSAPIFEQVAVDTEVVLKLYGLTDVRTGAYGTFTGVGVDNFTETTPLLTKDVTIDGGVTAQQKQFVASYQKSGVQLKYTRSSYGLFEDRTVVMSANVAQGELMEEIKATRTLKLRAPLSFAITAPKKTLKVDETHTAGFIVLNTNDNIQDGNAKLVLTGTGGQIKVDLNRDTENVLQTAAFIVSKEDWITKLGRNPTFTVEANTKVVRPIVPETNALTVNLPTFGKVAETATVTGDSVGKTTGDSVSSLKFNLLDNNQTALELDSSSVTVGVTDAEGVAVQAGDVSASISGTDVTVTFTEAKKVLKVDFTDSRVKSGSIVKNVVATLPLAKTEATVRVFEESKKSTPLTMETPSLVENAEYSDLCILFHADGNLHTPADKAGAKTALENAFGAKITVGLEIAVGVSVVGYKLTKFVAPSREETKTKTLSSLKFRRGADDDLGTNNTSVQITVNVVPAPATGPIKITAGVAAVDALAATYPLTKMCSDLKQDVEVAYTYHLKQTQPNAKVTIGALTGGTTYTFAVDSPTYTSDGKLQIKYDPMKRVNMRNATKITIGIESAFWTNSGKTIYTPSKTKTERAFDAGKQLNSLWVKSEFFPSSAPVDVRSNLQYGYHQIGNQDSAPKCILTYTIDGAVVPSSNEFAWLEEGETKVYITRGVTLVIMNQSNGAVNVSTAKTGGETLASVPAGQQQDYTPTQTVYLGNYQLILSAQADPVSRTLAHSNVKVDGAILAATHLLRRGSKVVAKAMVASDGGWNAGDVTATFVGKPVLKSANKLHLNGAQVALSFVDALSFETMDVELKASSFTEFSYTNGKLTYTGTPSEVSKASIAGPFEFVENKHGLGIKRSYTSSIPIRVARKEDLVSNISIREVVPPYTTTIHEDQKTAIKEMTDAALVRYVPRNATSSFKYSMLATYVAASRLAVGTTLTLSGYTTPTAETYIELTGGVWAKALDGTLTLAQDYDVPLNTPRDALVAVEMSLDTYKQTMTVPPQTTMPTITAGTGLSFDSGVSFTGVEYAGAYYPFDATGVTNNVPIELDYRYDVNGVVLTGDATTQGQDGKTVTPATMFAAEIKSYALTKPTAWTITSYDAATPTLTSATALGGQTTVYALEIALKSPANLDVKHGKLGVVAKTDGGDVKLETSGDNVYVPSTDGKRLVLFFKNGNFGAADRKLNSVEIANVRDSTTGVVAEKVVATNLLTDTEVRGVYSGDVESTTISGSSMFSSAAATLPSDNAIAEAGKDTKLTVIFCGAGSTEGADIREIIVPAGNTKKDTLFTLSTDNTCLKLNAKKYNAGSTVVNLGKLQFKFKGLTSLEADVNVTVFASDPPKFTTKVKHPETADDEFDNLSFGTGNQTVEVTAAEWEFGTSNLKITNAITPMTQGTATGEKLTRADVAFLADASGSGDIEINGSVYKATAYPVEYKSRKGVLYRPISGADTPNTKFTLTTNISGSSLVPKTPTWLDKTGNLGFFDQNGSFVDVHSANIGSGRKMQTTSSNEYHGAAKKGIKADSLADTTVKWIKTSAGAFQRDSLTIKKTDKPNVLPDDRMGVEPVVVEQVVYSDTDPSDNAYKQMQKDVDMNAVAGETLENVKVVYKSAGGFLLQATGTVGGFTNADGAFTATNKQVPDSSKTKLLGSDITVTGTMMLRESKYTAAFAAKVTFNPKITIKEKQTAKTDGHWAQAPGSSVRLGYELATGDDFDYDYYAEFNQDLAPWDVPSYVVPTTSTLIVKDDGTVTVGADAGFVYGSESKLHVYVGTEYTITTNPTRDVTDSTDAPLNPPVQLVNAGKWTPTVDGEYKITGSTPVTVKVLKRPTGVLKVKLNGSDVSVYDTSDDTFKLPMKRCVVALQPNLKYDIVVSDTNPAKRTFNDITPTNSVTYTIASGNVSLSQEKLRVQLKIVNGSSAVYAWGKSSGTFTVAGVSSNVKTRVGRTLAFSLGEKPGEGENKKIRSYGFGAGITENTGIDAASASSETSVNFKLKSKPASSAATAESLGFKRAAHGLSVSGSTWLSTTPAPSSKQDALEKCDVDGNCGGVAYHESKWKLINANSDITVDARDTTTVTHVYLKKTKSVYEQKTIKSSGRTYVPASQSGAFTDLKTATKACSKDGKCRGVVEKDSKFYLVDSTAGGGKTEVTVHEKKTNPTETTKTYFKEDGQDIDSAFHTKNKAYKLQGGTAGTKHATLKAALTDSTATFVMHSKEDQPAVKPVIAITASGTTKYIFTTSTSGLVDGVNLKLKKGTVYSFTIGSTHPFKITDPDGSTVVGTYTGDFEFTPTTQGDYSYVCTSHAAMNGTITVDAAVKYDVYTRYTGGTMVKATTSADVAKHEAVYARAQPPHFRTGVRYVAQAAVNAITPTYTTLKAARLAASVDPESVGVAKTTANSYVVVLNTTPTTLKSGAETTDLHEKVVPSNAVNSERTAALKATTAAKPLVTKTETTVTVGDEVKGFDSVDGVVDTTKRVLQGDIDSITDPVYKRALDAQRAALKKGGGASFAKKTNGDYVVVPGTTVNNPEGVAVYKSEMHGAYTFEGSTTLKLKDDSTVVTVDVPDVTTLNMTNAAPVYGVEFNVQTAVVPSGTGVLVVVEASNTADFESPVTQMHGKLTSNVKKGTLEVPKWVPLIDVEFVGDAASYKYYRVRKVGGTEAVKISSVRLVTSVPLPYVHVERDVEAHTLDETGNVKPVPAAAVAVDAKKLKVTMTERPVSVQVRSTGTVHLTDGTSTGSTVAPRSVAIVTGTPALRISPTRSVTLTNGIRAQMYKKGELEIQLSHEPKGTLKIVATYTGGTKEVEAVWDSTAKVLRINADFDLSSKTISTISWTSTDTSYDRKVRVWSSGRMTERTETVDSESDQRDSAVDRDTTAAPQTPTVAFALGSEPKSGKTTGEYTITGVDEVIGTPSSDKGTVERGSSNLKFSYTAISGGRTVTWTMDVVKNGAIFRGKTLEFALVAEPVSFQVIKGGIGSTTKQLRFQVTDADDNTHTTLGADTTITLITVDGISSDESVFDTFKGKELGTVTFGEDVYDSGDFNFQKVTMDPVQLTTGGVAKETLTATLGASGFQTGGPLSAKLVAYPDADTLATWKSGATNLTTLAVNKEQTYAKGTVAIVLLDFQKLVKMQVEAGKLTKFGDFTDTTSDVAMKQVGGNVKYSMFVNDADLKLGTNFKFGMTAQEAKAAFKYMKLSDFSPDGTFPINEQSVATSDVTVYDDLVINGVEWSSGNGTWYSTSNPVHVADAYIRITTNYTVTKKAKIKVGTTEFEVTTGTDNKTFATPEKASLPIEGTTVSLVEGWKYKTSAEGPEVTDNTPTSFQVTFGTPVDNPETIVSMAVTHTQTPEEGKLYGRVFSANTKFKYIRLNVTTTEYAIKSVSRSITYYDGSGGSVTPANPSGFVYESGYLKVPMDGQAQNSTKVTVAVPSVSLTKTGSTKNFVAVLNKSFDFVPVKLNPPTITPPQKLYGPSGELGTPPTFTEITKGYDYGAQLKCTLSSAVTGAVPKLFVANVFQDPAAQSGNTQLKDATPLLSGTQKHALNSKMRISLQMETNDGLVAQFPVRGVLEVTAKKGETAIAVESFSVNEKGVVSVTTANPGVPATAVTITVKFAFELQAAATVVIPAESFVALPTATLSTNGPWDVGENAIVTCEYKYTTSTPQLDNPKVTVVASRGSTQISTTTTGADASHSVTITSVADVDYNGSFTLTAGNYSVVTPWTSVTVGKETVYTWPVGEIDTNAITAVYYTGTSAEYMRTTLPVNVKDSTLQATVDRIWYGLKSTSTGTIKENAVDDSTHWEYNVAATPSNHGIVNGVVTLIGFDATKGKVNNTTRIAVRFKAPNTQQTVKTFVFQLSHADDLVKPYTAPTISSLAVMQQPQDVSAEFERTADGLKIVKTGTGTSRPGGNAMEWATVKSDNGSGGKYRHFCLEGTPNKYKVFVFDGVEKLYLSRKTDVNDAVQLGATQDEWKLVPKAVEHATEEWKETYVAIAHEEEGGYLRALTLSNKLSVLGVKVGFEKTDTPGALRNTTILFARKGMTLVPAKTEPTFAPHLSWIGRDYAEVGDAGPVAMRPTRWRATFSSKPLEVTWPVATGPDVRWGTPWMMYKGVVYDSHHARGVPYSAETLKRINRVEESLDSPLLWSETKHTIAFDRSVLSESTSAYQFRMDLLVGGAPTRVARSASQNVKVASAFGVGKDSLEYAWVAVTNTPDRTLEKPFGWDKIQKQYRNPANDSNGDTTISYKYTNDWNQTSVIPKEYWDVWEYHNTNWSNGGTTHSYNGPTRAEVDAFIASQVSKTFRPYDDDKPGNPEYVVKPGSETLLVLNGKEYRKQYFYRPDPKGGAPNHTQNHDDYVTTNTVNHNRWSTPVAVQATEDDWRAQLGHHMRIAVRAHTAYTGRATDDITNTSWLQSMAYLNLDSSDSHRSYYSNDLRQCVHLWPRSVNMTAAETKQWLVPMFQLQTYGRDRLCETIAWRVNKAFDDNGTEETERRPNKPHNGANMKELTAHATHPAKWPDIMYCNYDDDSRSLSVLFDRSDKNCMDTHMNGSVTTSSTWFYIIPDPSTYPPEMWEQNPDTFVHGGMDAYTGLVALCAVPNKEDQKEANWNAHEHYVYCIETTNRYDADTKMQSPKFVKYTKNKFYTNKTHLPMLFTPEAFVAAVNAAGNLKHSPLWHVRNKNTKRQSKNGSEGAMLKDALPMRILRAPDNEQDFVVCIYAPPYKGSSSDTHFGQKSALMQKRYIPPIQRSTQPSLTNGEVTHGSNARLQPYSQVVVRVYCKYPIEVDPETGRFRNIKSLKVYELDSDDSNDVRYKIDKNEANNSTADSRYSGYDVTTNIWSQPSPVEGEAGTPHADHTYTGQMTPAVVRNNLPDSHKPFGGRKKRKDKWVDGTVRFPGAESLVDANWNIDLKDSLDTDFKGTDDGKMHYYGDRDWTADPEFYLGYKDYNEWDKAKSGESAYFESIGRLSKSCTNTTDGRNPDFPGHDVSAVLGEDKWTSDYKNYIEFGYGVMGSVHASSQLQGLAIRVRPWSNHTGRHWEHFKQFNDSQSNEYNSVKCFRAEKF